MAGAGAEPQGYLIIKFLDNDDELDTYYEQGKLLGQGMFAETVEVIDVHDRERRFAMKVQPWTNQWFQQADPQVEALRLYKELMILNKILPKHPSIVELKDMLVSPVKVYMVQELCSSDSWNDFLLPANNDTGRTAFRELAEAVRTCHDHGVVHSDIKGDNVLFKRQGFKEVKLIDFGCSYYSPELAVMCHNEFDPTLWFAPHDLVPNSYSQKLHDVQAIGVMLHCLMAGKFVPPLFSDQIVQMQTTYRPRIQRFDAAALDLLTKIGPQPFGPEQDDEFFTIHQVLEHPWLTGLPGIPFQPHEPVRNLEEELAVLEHDFTVLKRILKEWIILPIRIIANDQALIDRYSVLGRVQSRTGETRVLQVLDNNYPAFMAMKIIHGRVRDKPEFLPGGPETRPPMSVYMEMLIILRILPPHDNIVSIKNVCALTEYVAVVKELLDGHSLENFFQNSDELSSRRIFWQIVDAVCFMHRHGVIHMDLHPDHIVFTDNIFKQCKIVNFSKALYIQEIAEERHENFSPERYVSPRLAQMAAAHANVQVDITALGRILHAMMTNCWEPDPARCGELWPVLGEFGPEADDLLSKIGPEPFGPAERDRKITMAEVRNHPWLHEKKRKRKKQKVNED